MEGSSQPKKQKKDEEFVEASFMMLNQD